MSRVIKFLSDYSKPIFFTWFILIIIASSIPRIPTLWVKTSDGISVRLDYVIHFLEFFGLSFFFLMWKVSMMKKKNVQKRILYLLLGMGFALFTEFQQLFIPGRSLNLVDCYFNIMGLGSGILFWGYGFHKKKWLSINI